MNRMEYDNAIRKQVFWLPAFCEEQLLVCFGPELKGLMSMAEIFDARKVILTGCGASYAAALAMAPVIEKYCDCFGVETMRMVEFTRFLSGADIGIGEPNSPLVIVISERGDEARVCEALMKADRLGAFPILLTENPSAAAGKYAKRVYVTGTEAIRERAFGLCSYFGSLVGLIAFASRMGHVRGTLPPFGPAQFKEAIRSYVERFGERLEQIDRQIFELAWKWRDLTRFDLIGDDVEYGSAFFGAAKLLQCAGCAVSVDDSEDWCHINYFIGCPEKVGTVVLADKNQPSFGRIRETVGSAVRIGRPVLVVTNADAGVFEAGAEVCTIPDAPEGFGWMLPLLDYIPAALLAGYLSAFGGSSRSIGGEEDRTDNSKIEIYI